MLELTSVLFIAFILDLLIGDPFYKYHPIRIIGQCITHFERALRKFGWDGKGGGIILVLIVGGIMLSGYLILNTLFFRLHRWLFFCFNLYLCYACLALGDLLNHIKPVIDSLEAGDLNRTKKSMAILVGREVQALDEQALGRAAVETMAENFVDGFLSPLFWYLTGGILSFFSGTSAVTTSIGFMLIFKVASTLDSMVGYRNKRYFHFGWAGARLDDLMNFLPARLSIIFLFLGAGVTGLRPFKGARLAFRDRLKHDSPNAGHPESFVAGALGVRLGGPIKYPEAMKDKPWLGDGTSNVTILHIHQCAALLRCSAWIAVFTLLSPFFFI